MAIRLAKEAQTVNNMEGMDLNIIDQVNNIWHINFTM